MLKEKIQNGVEKVKTFVKDHKKGLIKGGAIAGGTAIGLGVIGTILHNNRCDYDEEYFEEEDEFEINFEPEDDSEVEETEEAE